MEKNAQIIKHIKSESQIASETTDRFGNHTLDTRKAQHCNHHEIFRDASLSGISAIIPPTPLSSPSHYLVLAPSPPTIPTTLFSISAITPHYPHHTQLRLRS